MRIARWLVASLLLCATAARAGPSPDTDPAAIGAAVAAVEAAAASRDAGALVAAAAGVDPWIIADVLLARGAGATALAWAAAVEGTEAEALRAYARRPLREPATARAALDAGLAACARKDWASALDALARDADLGESVLRARWLAARAGALRESSRPHDAAVDFTAAGTVADRMGWLRFAAACLRDASRAHFDDDALADAERTARAVLEVRRRQGVPRDVAVAEIDLAFVVGRLGDFRQAAAILGDALPRVPAPSRERATVLTRLGQARLRLGRLAAAHEDLSAARRMLRAGTASLLELEIAGELSGLHASMGDGVQARSWAVEASRLSDVLAANPRTSARDGRRQRAIAAARLATCDLEDGRLDEAVAAYTTAREEMLKAGDSRHAARTLLNVGEARRRQRRWAECRDASLSSAALLREIGDIEAALHADGNRAEAEFALGRRDVAEKMQIACLEEAARLGFHSIVLRVCVSLARARGMARDPARALDAVERGVSVLTDLYGGLAEGERVGARAKYGDLFDAGVEIADEMKDEERFFRYLEAGRAGALLDALGNREALRAVRIDPELEAARTVAAREIGALQPQLEAAGDDLVRLRAAASKIEAARTRYQAAVQAIQRRHRSTAYVLYPRPDTLADTAAALATDEAIVEFARVGDRLLAFVVTHDGGRRVPIGRLADLEWTGAETSWREAIDDSDATLDAATRAMARARDAVWTPLDATLGAKIRRIYVSIDAPIDSVPMPAILGAGGGPSISYVPSATTLAILRGDAPRNGESVLALGVSDYGSKQPAGLIRSRIRRLSNLPKARDEASAIGDEGHVVVDAEATESGLRQRLLARRRWSAIHFSCHGLVDLASPSLSSIALTPGGDDDGFFTAMEAFETPIPADIVTLSACETSIGPSLPGEGIVPLVRAFLFAGTPRVVASLWPVDDDAADVFMRAFHAEWRKKASAADAMNTAREAVRKTPGFRHPKYWASWVLWGLQN